MYVEPVGADTGKRSANDGDGVRRSFDALVTGAACNATAEARQ